MKRAGSSLPPLEFLEAVSLAFQEVQARHLEKGTEQAFRAAPSFQLFEAALQFGSEAGSCHSILVLGCAQGFAGKTAEFALPTVTRICWAGPGTRIDSLDLSPGMLRSQPEGVLAGCEHSYDLVVSHSLLHFVPDVSQAFDLMRKALRPSGRLVLSHEPNATFWRNAACAAAIADLRKQRPWRWKRFLRPASILSRVRRQTSGTRESFWDQVNQVLEQRFAFEGRLAENEIRRLVDVHRPEAAPGDFRIGFNGFDIDVIAKSYLRGFRLIWMATCDHLGYVPRRSLSKEWRRKEAALAAEHPRDGSVITACFLQEPTE